MVGSHAKLYIANFGGVCNLLQKHDVSEATAKHWLVNSTLLDRRNMHLVSKIRLYLMESDLMGSDLM